MKPCDEELYSQSVLKENETSIISALQYHVA